MSSGKRALISANSPSEDQFSETYDGNAWRAAGNYNYFRAFIKIYQNFCNEGNWENCPFCQGQWSKERGYQCQKAQPPCLRSERRSANRSGLTSPHQVKWRGEEAFIYNFFIFSIQLVIQLIFKKDLPMLQAEGPTSSPSSKKSRTTAIDKT